jgi:hypothetical protein
MRMYRRRFGHYPNLLFPRTFTEKIQVAKLTWRSPLLPQFVDKIAAKQFVAKHFGTDLVTPNLYVGDRLPPRAARDWPLPFVVKPSHWSGGNFFVRTDEDRDWDRIEPELDGMLARHYGLGMGEWAYGEIRPRVLVEPFLGTDDPPADFKLYTFGGRVAYFSVADGRLSQLRYAVYDRDWTRVAVKLAVGSVLPPSPPPAELDRMVAIAEEIGKRLPFCRVDFYEVDDRARFGEITLYPSSGFTAFDPPEYDRVFGDLFPSGRPARQW